MLKSLFSKPSAEDQHDQALVIANLNLMNRVTQVLQSATRTREKNSTLTSLRPLNS
jgi:hypothetical protein